MTDNSQAEAPPAPAKPGTQFNVALLISLILAALLAWQWFDTRAQIAEVQQDFARRLGDIVGVAKDNRAIVKDNQDALRETQIKLGLLESKLQESRNQQIALESLYQELSRNSDEWAIVEVQQMLDIASQQLQLAGNVKAALIALQMADARLQRIDRPQLIPLRKIINKDIDRLKSAPYVDTVAISVRLDDLISKVDNLPLAMDTRPLSAPSEAKGPSAQSAWLKFAREIWQDVKQMVRIQNTAGQEIPLLTPDQFFFLRENLKLRLLSARVALLLRDETSFKSDIDAAQEWVTRYYDGSSEETKAALASLRQLQENRVSIAIPDISASLDAARNFKLVRDKATK
ncbi:MAG TPA: uroporphyrinogen-III C-methyltransferase [Burkholderiales bacterium]|nr:uroporphyrinogen-III C-methyltransferase [Burkholderiales bacterium]